MKVSGFYLSHVSAAAAIRDLRWRISALEASQARYSADSWRRKYNDSSIKVYGQILRGWQLEQLDIIRQRVAHSARLHQIHEDLARQHERDYQKALDHLRKVKREADTDTTTSMEA